MAMARVCDACGQPVKAPFKQMKVLSADNDDQLPRDYKTVKSLDFHEKCYNGFRSWLAEVQDKSQMFKGISA